MERGETGIIFEESMDQHKNLWDPSHLECPERFTHVLRRCEELNLISRCKRIPQREATKEEIVHVHEENLYNLIESTSGETNEAKLEDYSSNFDAVYVHPSTFKLAKISVGSTLELVKSVVNRDVQNGMAIIRPPGHHAQKAVHNGFCFFNNVAVATKHALDNLGLKRILIVDWDVHHGQGTQQFFYDDPRVLFFSIHRFQNGTFWPFLKESDYDYIGEGAGTGFNFNLPLNDIGMKNEDYLAIFQQILLPVAAEFKPELVIVSCGFDAATGCPEGEMLLTPAFYSHLTNSLMNLADGKIAVVLEGGYCLESLAEGAALTLRTLLGDPCPILVDPLDKPSDSIQESILNCILSHRRFWKCLNVQDTFSPDEFTETNPEFHKVVKFFRGDVTGYPTSPKFPTKDICPKQSPEVKLYFKNRLGFLRDNTNLKVAKTRLAVVETQLKLKQLSQRVALLPSLQSLIEDIASFKCRSGVTHDSSLVIHDLASKFFKKTAILDLNSKESLQDALSNNLYIQLHHSEDHLQLLEKGNPHFIDIPLKNPGDMEYILIIQQLILPFLYEFNPDLIILTSKFSEKVSKSTYALIVGWISSLANGRLIVNTTKGYHEDGVTECAKVLLGDSVLTSNTNVSDDLIPCFETIRRVNALHKNNWKFLQFNKKLPRS